jgi:hypothetical protein
MSHDLVHVLDGPPAPRAERSHGIDFNRVASTIDVDMLQRACVLLIGVGGGRRKAELLAHLGVGTLILVDPDVVESRNPATQGHHEADVGFAKVRATADACAHINRDTTIVPLQQTWQDALLQHADLIHSADFIIAATDSYNVNRTIRQFAIAHDKDLVEAWIWPNGDVIEHVVTWSDVIAEGGGCGTCHTKGRLDAYEAGFENPPDVPTYILPAELSCVQTALITVARLHMRSGSRLPITGIAKQFAHRPFQLTRLNPLFWSELDAPFCDTPESYETFMTRAYALDTPKGWTCPDCGTPGTV